MSHQGHWIKLTSESSKTTTGLVQDPGLMPASVRPSTWLSKFFRSRNRFSSQIAHSQSFAKAIEPHVSHKTHFANMRIVRSVTQPWQLETTPKATPRQWFRLRLNLKGNCSKFPNSAKYCYKIYTFTDMSGWLVEDFWKSHKYTQTLSDAPVLTNMLHNSRSQSDG